MRGDRGQETGDRKAGRPLAAGIAWTTDCRFRCPLSAVRCLLSAAILLFATGCIRRSLTIRSEPPGAELIVNDKHLGTTPYSYDFQWYGWYRITLMKDGYERLDDRTLIKAPFYLWIPFDLVMELLPLRIRDDKALSYGLTPRQPLPEPSPPVMEEAPPATEE